MNHTHSYLYWHAHEHTHCDESIGYGGHYHRWAQTHEHGKKSGSTPHTHQARQAHSGAENVHHHAIEDHEEGGAEEGT